MSKLTATDVAHIVGVSVPTLTNWYKWYNDDKYKKPVGTPSLPSYEQIGSRTPRYWDKGDVDKLIKFKEWLPKGRAGVMGEFNSKSWVKKEKPLQTD